MQGALRGGLWTDQSDVGASLADATRHRQPRVALQPLLLLFEPTVKLSTGLDYACVRDLSLDSVETAAWQLLHQSHESAINAQR